ncbi:MAG: FliH/SctL family protein [Granulosicoccaceae bacterium]
MNILALSTGEGVGLYGGKLVYSAAETQALRSCIETADYLHSMKNDAVEQHEQARLKTEAQGFEQGLQQGRIEAKKEMTAALLMQQQALHQAQQTSRDQSVAIALDVVKKIASNIAPEQMVLSLAQAAAAELAPDSRITLRTHSDNVNKLKLALNEQSNTNPVLKQIYDVIGDESLEHDACVLETVLGSIEADLKTQLAAIEQHLMSG